MIKGTESIRGSLSMQRMLDNPKAFQELFQSAAWSIWSEWAEEMAEAYKTQALEGLMHEEREEARAMYQALKKFCSLPEFLVKLQEEVLATSSPADSPLAHE